MTQVFVEKKEKSNEGHIRFLKQYKSGDYFRIFLKS